MENKTITQYPIAPNVWLYQDQEDGNRIFTDYIIRNEDDPEWKQCTQAAREEWEEQHKPQPEPQPENPADTNEPQEQEEQV